MVEVETKLPAFVKRGNTVASVAGFEQLVVKGLAEVVTHSRDGRIWGSNAAFCARQTMLAATRTSSEVQGAASKAYMAIGSAIEQLVVDALFKAGALLFHQYKLPPVPELNLGGYVDAIVCINSKLLLLEIKSCTTLPSTPKLDHRAQALIYSAITGLPASVVYFSRSVADFKGELKLAELPLNATPNDWLAALYTVAYARLAIEAKRVPPIPSGWTKSICGYCPFVPNCWDHEPLPTKEVTLRQHSKLAAEAAELATRLASPEEVAKRRNGVLKHLQNHGTATAKSLLTDSDWSALL